MSMSYSDHFLTEISDKIFSQLEKEGKMASGRFDEKDYSRLEREELAKKLDELWEKLSKK